MTTSASERYLTATNSTQLKHSAEKTCDADVLLAAGYASARDPAKSLALDVYRLRANRDMRGANSIAERMAQKVMQRSKPSRAARPTISRIHAIDLCLTVLKVWHMPTCPVCGGHGHPNIPGTPHLDTTRKCKPCDGTGQRQLKRHVKPERLPLAEWIIDHLNDQAGQVFSDMARLLSSRGKLDL